MGEKPSYDIEGYKELSLWNRREADALLVYDRVFVTVALAGFAVPFSLPQYKGNYLYAFVGSWLVLSYWVLLCWRFRVRAGQRFCIMTQIECRLEFEAHKLMNAYPPPIHERIHEQHLRYAFYWAVLILATVGAFSPSVRPCPIESSYYIFIVCSWAASMLVSLYLWLRQRKTRKKRVTSDNAGYRT